EFEDARMIQRGLLPTAMPQTSAVQLASSWRPADGVGGDCFDALTFPGGGVGITIADVAGKGVPAALLMSNLQAAVRAFARGGAWAAGVTTGVTRLLCRNMVGGGFVPFCSARLAVAWGRLTYATAAHNPPLLVHAGGRIDSLAPGGTVLGVFAEGTYELGEFPIGPGDRLVLYTDGITEGRNAAGDEFGEERLAESAVAHRALAADEMLAAMLRDVEAFNGGAYEDDATLIVAAL